MSIILDLLIVAIIGLSVYLSAKHGFVRTLIEVIGFIAAFLIAFAVSSPLAEFTYDKTVRPAIVSSVENDDQTANTDVTDKLKNSEAIEKMWDSLPDWAKNYASDLGITKENIKDEAENVSGNTTDMVEAVSDKTVKPVATKILGIIYSTVIVIILLIISKILARAVNKLVSFSLVGKINSILGGVVGIFKGIAFAIVICMIISVTVVLSKNGFWIFTAEDIDSTILFKLFYRISPFI